MNVQTPSEPAVTVPITETELKPYWIFTVAPAVVLPVRVGVVTRVTPSVVNAPVSEAVVRLGGSKPASNGLKISALPKLLQAAAVRLAPPNSVPPKPTASRTRKVQFPMER